jgi:hypothetical protein
VTVDQFFQLDDLVRLALSFRRVEPDQLETFSVPGRSAFRAGQSVVEMDTVQAERIFAALRNAEDPAKVLPATQAQQP